MRRRFRAAPALLLGALALALPGCGRQKSTEVTPEAVRRLELEEIRDMYKFYVSENHRPPTQLAQFKRYTNGFWNGFQALQSGTCVLCWGTELPEAGGSAGVLAYEKDAPTRGGAVLLTDGTIRTMTAQEFQASAPRPRS